MTAGTLSILLVIVFGLLSAVNLYITLCAASRFSRNQKSDSHKTMRADIIRTDGTRGTLEDMTREEIAAVCQNCKIIAEEHGIECDCTECDLKKRFIEE